MEFRDDNVFHRPFCKGRHCRHHSCLRLAQQPQRLHRPHWQVDSRTTFHGQAVCALLVLLAIVLVGVGGDGNIFGGNRTPAAITLSGRDQHEQMDVDALGPLPGFMANHSYLFIIGAHHRCCVCPTHKLPHCLVSQLSLLGLHGGSHNLPDVLPLELSTTCCAVPSLECILTLLASFSTTFGVFHLCICNFPLPKLLTGPHVYIHIYMVEICFS